MTIRETLDQINLNPEMADEQAKKWHNFTLLFPELLACQSKEEFAMWAKKNPQYNIDTSIWAGKEITDAYFYLRDQQERAPQNRDPEINQDINSFNPSSLVYLSLLFPSQARIMKEDKDYWRIIDGTKDTEGLKNKWLKEHNQKDFNSKEGLDYLYGNLDDPSASSLHKDTEKIFREKFPEKARKYDLEKSKIYNHPYDDPAIARIKLEIDQHASARHRYLKAQGNPVTLEEVKKQVSQKAWRNFVAEQEELGTKISDDERQKRKEKLKVYAEKHKEINEAVNTFQQEKQEDSFRSGFSRESTEEDFDYPENEEVLLPNPSSAPSHPSTSQPIQPSSSPTAPSLPGQPVMPGQNLFQRSIGKGIDGINNVAQRFGAKKTAQKAAVQAEKQLAKQLGTKALGFLAGGGWAIVTLFVVMGFVVIIAVITSDNATSIATGTGGGGGITPTPGGGGGTGPGGTPSASLSVLLPNPLPEDTAEEQKATENAINLLNNNKNNVTIYQQAAGITGIPWEIFAGIHYIEGGFGPNSSLVSGRAIGAVEPDVPRSACSGAAIGPGLPVPISGGCGFRSLFDSALYAGNLLIQKIGKSPQNFQDITTAASRYNGGGNANCGENVPYSNSSNCPPLFKGEDDPYALNYFDIKHQKMYLIYCADLTRCHLPVEFKRPGILTIAKGIAKFFK